MKKLMLPCKRHGVVLHRCTKHCYRKPDHTYDSVRIEQCFACIAEGAYTQHKLRSKEIHHISLRGGD